MVARHQSVAAVLTTRRVGAVVSGTGSPSAVVKGMLVATNELVASCGVRLEPVVITVTIKGLIATEGVGSSTSASPNVVIGFREPHGVEGVHSTSRGG